ncbi:MAG: autotransporter-associated beta strand repeat-containing protein, partial [Chitinispirillaceae bacterium]
MNRFVIGGAFNRAASARPEQKKHVEGVRKRGLGLDRSLNAVVVTIFVLIGFSSSFAVTKTVNSGGGADYTSVDQALAATDNGMVVDTILITDQASVNYTVSQYVSASLPDPLYIRGQQTDPDQFSVLDVMQGDGFYNFFNEGNSLIFENLVFHNTSPVDEEVFKCQEPGVVLGFRNCTFRNQADAYFVAFIEDGSPSTLFFENCLFTNNELFVNVNYWAGTPVISFMNCTFDGNDEIMNLEALANSSDVSFTNSIFTNNAAVFNGDDLSNKITHSLTDEASGYGSNCLYSADPKYLEATRTLPGHWQVDYTSPAREMGTSTGAPESDIAGNTRAATPGVGCWVAADPIFLPEYLSWDVSDDPATQTGDGTWGVDDYWTEDGTTLVAWPAGGNSAYFGGEDGTYSITVDGVQVVDTIRIGASGYSISGDTLEIGGDVVVHPDISADISAVLSGSSGLLYNGGSLVLSGANSYTGATQISTGQLSVADAAALGDDADGTTVSDGAALEIDGGLSISEPLVLNGSGSGNGVLVSVNGSNTLSGTVTLDSASTVDIGAPLVIGGVVDGAGDLTKTGTARLTLGGANTFTGITAISEGDVLLTNTAGLGTSDGETDVSSGAALVLAGDASAAEYSEPLTLGGTLRLQTGTASSAVMSGDITLGSANSVDVPDAEDTLILTGIVDGSELNKTGEGMLLLTGENTCDGITLAEGSLQIGNGGASGSVSGNITTASGTQVIVDRSGTLTCPDSIKGSGSLVINGGTVVFTNVNTYSGGTTVENGTLQIGDGTSGMIEGDIVNDGTVIFNRSNDDQFAGVISGTGAVTKQGEGTLTLSGDNSYEGTTTVSGGTLLVNGTHSGSGDLTVENGAALGGNGKVSANISVADGGVLSPGEAAQGTLSSGSLALSGTSELNFDVGSTSDSVTVKGDLILDGVLNITDADGFGTGVYNLFSCTGDIIDNVLEISSDKPVDTLHYRVQVYGSVVRLIVSDDLPVSNSISVRGRRVDSTSLEVTITGYKDIPHEANSLTSHADTVALWHRYGSFYPNPPDVTADPSSLSKFALSDMKTDAPDGVYTDTITIPAVSDEEFYFVCGTAFWHDISNGNDSIPDFVYEQGDSVFMVDPETLTDNPLAVSAQKVSGSEVSLTIDGYETVPHQVDPHRPYADSIGVWYRFGSFYDSPDDSASVIKFSVADLKEHSPDFTQTVTVAPSEQPSDSFYFFNATVLWRIPPDD